MRKASLPGAELSVVEVREVNGPGAAMSGSGLRIGIRRVRMEASLESGTG